MHDYAINYYFVESSNLLNLERSKFFVTLTDGITSLYSMAEHIIN